MDNLLKKALVHHHAGQLGQAETLYRQILEDSPGHPQASHLLGVIMYQTGKYAIALGLIDQAILLKPDFAEAFCNRGLVLHQLQQYRQAIESFAQAILLKPDYADAYNNRGTVFHELKQYQLALENFDQALLLKPDYAQAHNNRGGALDGLQQYQQALESYDRCLVLTPDYATAHNGRAIVLQRLRQYQQAIESFDQVILRLPAYAAAYNGRGTALLGLQQYQQALDSFDQALRLSADFAAAYDNRGHALLALRQYQQALQSWDQALQLKPGDAETYSNRGTALYLLRQYQQASESFNQALLLQPDYDYLTGTRIHLKQSMCDWQEVEAQCRDLEAQIDRNKKVIDPFSLLSISSSAALQRKGAEIFVSDKYPSCPETIARRPKRNRIRIGYFSANFHHHAVCYLMAELFERHDRSKFELLGFSFGQDHDAMRIRVAAAMDQFFDVRSLSDREVAQLSREFEVDIAVDLMGFTQHARPEIFAQRAAPVQVNYLGYPATMGADFIDYIVADHRLIPPASRRHYAEKIAYLPDSFQANDSTRLISSKPCRRFEMGLPERGMVYCCFNNNYKINPAVFNTWMHILERVEGSVLWLLEPNPWAGNNLRREAGRRGIAPERLIFGKRLPLAEHLARHSLADLFLDTLPYNAHTTASDALWAGLPVLTCMGEAFASRVAASLLHAIDLPELVTTTKEEYEALAIELGTNAERLHAITTRLRQNRLTTPLFDISASTRHLEAAYSAMYDRCQADLVPEHIYVARLPNYPGCITPASGDQCSQTGKNAV